MLIRIETAGEGQSFVSVVGGDRFVTGGDVETPFDGHVVTDVPALFGEETVTILRTAAERSEIDVQES